MRLPLALAALAAALRLCAEPLALDALPETFLRGERPDAWPREGLVLLECWARWCGPCLRAMPHLEALHQALKGEGVRVVGVNVWDRATDREILDFLARQPTPPTYDQAVDRAGALPKRLGVKGIPHAIAVRGGDVVWQGHPATLTAEKLRALRDARKPREEAKPDPLAATLALEARADAAAARGDWAAAQALQAQALRAHPLAAKAAPGADPAAGAPALGRLPERPCAQTTAEGDAAPYAALLGEPLPADGLPTLVAYWPNPFWIATLNWATLASLPDRRLAKALPYPHRVLTVAPAKARPHLEKLLAPLAWRGPGPRFADDVPPGLFGVDGRFNPPFVAYFRGGRLLWKGPLEALPAALRAPTPPATPEAAQAAAKQVEARQEALAGAFRSLRSAAPAERDALLRGLLGEPLPRGWGTLLLPQILATPYQAKDLDEGKRRLDWCLETFKDDPGALEMLLKVVDAWPELALETVPRQSRAAERLAELNDRDDPAYAQAWFTVAAELAARAGEGDRAAALYARALAASPAACRLRQFRAHLPALPTR